jgi:hypothetical protein
MSDGAPPKLQSACQGFDSSRVSGVKNKLGKSLPSPGVAGIVVSVDEHAGTQRKLQRSASQVSRSCRHGGRSSAGGDCGESSPIGERTGRARSGLSLSFCVRRWNGSAITRLRRPPSVSQSPDQAAAHFGWFARFAAIDMLAASERARAELGWTPTQPGLLAELDQRYDFKA